MKPIECKTEFIPRYLNIWEFLDKNIIESAIDIDRENILLTYKSNNEDNIIDNAEYSNSIAIASAITAYARVFMSKFKNNPDFILLYSDTDSAFIEGILPDNLVGKELGQFKLSFRIISLILSGAGSIIRHRRLSDKIFKQF